jgi:hypothetical protein
LAGAHWAAQVASSKTPKRKDVQRFIAVLLSVVFAGFGAAKNDRLMAI